MNLTIFVAIFFACLFAWCFTRGIKAYTGAVPYMLEPWGSGQGVNLLYIGSASFLLLIPLLNRLTFIPRPLAQTIGMIVLPCFILPFLGILVTWFLPPFMAPFYIRDAWKYGVDYSDYEVLKNWVAWRKTPEFKKFKISGNRWAPKEFLSENSGFLRGQEHLQPHLGEIFPDTFITISKKGGRFAGPSRIERAAMRVFGKPKMRPARPGGYKNRWF